ncbi:uncharacterized protein [Periplaneta americana]|uniref:uncharacterized protein isoform X2 n=1 Tax=Periplaneta americana TaxID=6978 RepID=UPI0037E771A0
MDSIKTEPEVDPLAVQPHDDAIKEEKNPSSDEARTVESKDSSCWFKWEVKIEESAVPVKVSVINCDSQVDTFGVCAVKEESVLEVTTVESEVLSQSFLQ